MRPFRPAPVLLLAATLGAVCLARPAFGQSSDAVAAEAMFDEGRRLVAQGKYADACPKFVDSERLEPSPGTLLNLASCWEKLGRTATAWATYRAAASAANAGGRKDYVATAQKHADALAPRLAHLTVSVPQGLDGLQVKRDGVTIASAEWGLAIPVDLGTHAVEASAPGYKAWGASVEVPNEGAAVTVNVPSLEAKAPEAASPSAPVPPRIAPPATPEPQGGEGKGGLQRATGLVIAGVGVVGLGVATIFAVSAKSIYNASLSNCEPGNPGLCSPAGVAQRGDARATGNAASVTLGVGAAALAAGALVWIVAPRSSPARSTNASLFAGPSLGGAVIGGGW